uniref:Uncharacterized protein n=1 Tax=Arundo donax TaxID=35708 RepID=A0A0A8Z3A3_ARUDO
MKRLINQKQQHIAGDTNYLFRLI